MHTELLSPEYKALLHDELVAVYKSAIERAQRDATILVEYLDFSQVCDMFNISPNTLAKWRKKGLPAYQIDGKKFIKRSEINKFIETHEI